MHPTALVETASSRKALAGFFLSGLLFAFPGAILPAWGYHLRPHFVTIGNYFLCVNAGLLVSVLVARAAWKSRGPALVLVVACATACASLVFLSFTAPPVVESRRMFGLFGLGLGAGTLNIGILQAISPAYRLAPAATINIAGALFGLGCAVLAILIAGTFNVYTVPSILLLVAIVPAFFALLFRQGNFRTDPIAKRRSLPDVAREFTIPSAVLFSLVLFCQFGNEWAVAGWLPLFLILRVGLSPTTALLILASYWLALMLGRLFTQALMPRLHPGKILLSSLAASMFGCVVLGLTDNLFGASFGTLLVGFGFAPIYQLVVEKIGARFPHYHPGFFNGIFSVALTGGMLAPAILGYVSEYSGIGVVMALPLLGSFVVFLLVLAIWLESKLASTKL